MYDWDTWQLEMNPTLYNLIIFYPLAVVWARLYFSISITCERKKIYIIPWYSRLIFLIFHDVCSFIFPLHLFGNFFFISKKQWYYLSILVNLLLTLETKINVSNFNEKKNKKKKYKKKRYIESKFLFFSKLKYSSNRENEIV